jgi:putative ABC transport system permease protein
LTSNFVTTVLQIGALYGIVALAICVSFRFLSFPDLTVDGSFVLGAAVSAMLVIHGCNAWFSLFLASTSGFVAGVVTASWNRMLGINKFFAGILTMMMLYSLNLRILGGANVSILRSKTVFDGFSQSELVLAIACLVWLFVCAVVTLTIFHTRFGLSMRALASNIEAFRMGTVGKWITTALGIGFANALSGLAGALVGQYQRFTDVNMGLGVTVSGFAALFLGEALILGALFLARTLSFSRLREFLERPNSAWTVRGEVIATGLGSLALVTATTATLYLGLQPSDLKFVAAFFLLVGMVLRRKRLSYLLVPPSSFEK